MEVQGLYIAEFLNIHPFSDGGRAIETLGDGPWASQFLGLPLHIAGCEIDAHGNGIVVAVGKTHGDILAQAADAHHQLGLIVDAAHEVGNEKRFAVFQQGRVGLGKDDGLGSLSLCLFREKHDVVELRGMFGIVHANGKDLHDGGVTDDIIEKKEPKEHVLTPSTPCYDLSENRRKA